MGNIFGVREIVEKIKEQSIETYMIFIDFKRDYHNAP